jgi:hypothetical protein
LNIINKLFVYVYEENTDKKNEVIRINPDLNENSLQDIIVECKQRKKFLLRTIDHGIFSKILALFEINDEDFIKQDVSLIAKCKKKWKDVIKFYINKAKLKLKEEVDSNKENTDLIIEVTEISKILDDITNEIDLKEFKSPKDIAKYWPDILRPSPIYVINND